MKPLKPPNGRPRDPRIDEAVLRAAADLVVEVGYADLTIAAIAERAGTSKPAIYGAGRARRTCSTRRRSPPREDAARAA